MAPRIPLLLSMVLSAQGFRQGADLCCAGAFGLGLPLAPNVVLASCKCNQSAGNVGDEPMSDNNDDRVLGLIESPLGSSDDRAAEPESDRDAAIREAVEAALEKRENESLDVAQFPAFDARQLGATAPHDCSIWSADYRDKGDGESPEDVRRLTDPGVPDQLDLLLQAGLCVRPSRD
jgi:hypothetical protein